MSATARAALSVSVVIVAAAATVWATTSRTDPSIRIPDRPARESVSKSLLLDFDAAQKAWMLQPTLATAWMRADALEKLAGADAAAHAWDDYLRLDATSPQAREIQRRRTSNVGTMIRDPALTTESELTAWSEAVLGGDDEEANRALDALIDHGKRQQSRGDAFVADVARWMSLLPNDGKRKAKAADAVLLLQSGRKALAVRDLARAEILLKRAELRLREPEARSQC